MPRKIIKLNGPCKALSNLIGISFRLIPDLKENCLPLCSQKKICNSKDFNKQRQICREIEISIIKKSNKPDFIIHSFKCGLSELLMPVFNNGDLKGIILSDKIKEQNTQSQSRIANYSSPPSLDAKQIVSLTTILNYCRFQFDEVISLHQDSIANTKDKVIINRAKNFIERNYHHPKIPLKDLAKEVNASYFYLCRLFKKELNATFTRYVALVRLKAALRLLQNQNLTIAQVSYAVGFSEAQYFDRVFKKILKCSPKEYRFSQILKREKIRQKVLSQIF